MRYLRDAPRTPPLPPFPRYVKRPTVKEALDALGEGTSAPKEAQTVAAALLKGIADRARTDKPAKNARDGYVTEHMEIACYQLLERLAERADHGETAEGARRNRG